MKYLFIYIYLFAIYLFSFNKYLQIIWLKSLFIISFIGVYFINTMGIEINQAIIKNIFETNIKEATELVGVKFVFYSIFSFLFMLLIYFMLLKHLLIRKALTYFFSLFIIVALFFVFTKIDYKYYKTFIKYDTEKIVPFNILNGMFHYFRTCSREQNVVKNDISKFFKFIPVSSEQPIVSILVIGESARADRFQINGCAKNTTPYLNKLNNLITFKNATSCDTSTASSVPCLITRTNREDFNFPIKEYSFVKVFRDNGFETYWFDLQGEGDTIKPFCHEANHCITLDTKYDTDVLPKINLVVKNIKKNTLIVIHTMGSHKDYNERVPDTQKKFKPVCPNRDYENCSYDILLNSYDNTILYTDLFLSDLINIIKNKNSFMLYVSDHGESLGESYGGFKRYGHASPYSTAPQEQTHIPFLLWFSNNFITNKKLDINNVNNTKEVSHDNVFSTMLGCSNFKSKFINDNLNLCNNTIP